MLEPVGLEPEVGERVEGLAVVIVGAKEPEVISVDGLEVADFEGVAAVGIGAVEEEEVATSLKYVSIQAETKGCQITYLT